MDNSITVQVDQKTARLYQKVTAKDREKLRVLLSICLRELVSPSPQLDAVMDEISEKAVARGLTPDILESLLDEC